MQVLLIDDDGDDRQLTALVLGTGLPAATITEVADAAGYADALGRDDCDVAIAPPCTAWGDGVALLAALRRRHPRCVTVLLGNLRSDTLQGTLASNAADAVLARTSRGLASLAATVGELLEARRSQVAIQARPSMSEARSSVSEPPDRRGQLAAVCHDLQDPLQVILHTARRIAPGDGEAPTPRELQRIVGSAERMQAMLDALTEGDDLSERPLQREVIALDAVVDEVLRDLEGRDALKGAQILRAPLPTLHADREQLRRLFENLLGNALKFRSATSPQISVQSVERAGEWLLLVADNGIGIAPADAQRVFSMFVRLHGPGDYPGSGVGLAICRRIARAHGGDVSVQPTPGGGATFIVSLPRGVGEARQ